MGREIRERRWSVLYDEKIEPAALYLLQLAFFGFSPFDRDGLKIGARILLSEMKSEITKRISVTR